VSQLAGVLWSHACVSLLQALAADPQEEGLQEVVRNVFGFPGFRGHQLPVVQAVLQGRSTLAIMPTGVRDMPLNTVLQ
jgi:superfamily II DNA helicase RecQ